MSQEPIRLTISPNETNTKERVDDLQKALASFKGQIIDVGKDPKQPADIMLRKGAKAVHIEVKDTNGSNDLWGSKQGHLGDQLVNLIDENATSLIVVMSSLDETLQEVPTMTNEGRKSKYAGKNIQEGNKTSLRALSADCVGSSIPIFYLSKDRVLSFKWALSYAKNILEGGDPFQWCSRHKGKARKIRALLGNGIGPKNAEILLEHFLTIQNIANANFDELKAVKGIGPERAIAIMELMK